MLGGDRKLLPNSFYCLGSGGAPAPACGSGASFTQWADPVAARQCGKGAACNTSSGRAVHLPSKALPFSVTVTPCGQKAWHQPCHQLILFLLEKAWEGSLRQAAPIIRACKGCKGLSKLS